MSEKKVNKSDLIRQVAEANPGLGPTAIANLCQSQHGITVSPAHVNQATGKNKAKAAAPAAPAAAKAATPAKATAAKAAAPAKATAPKAAATPAKAAAKPVSAKGPVSPFKSAAPATSCSHITLIKDARDLINAAGGVDSAVELLRAVAG